MATKKAAAPAKKAVVPAAKKTAAPAAAKKAVAVKKLTKSELVRLVAEKLEITSKQSAAFFDLLTETAIAETKKSGEFTIPGLGKLVKAQRAARVGRNPQTGEAIKIKAKTAVKFRVAKAAKDAIAPVK
ncbi:DNA-binding protein HU-beta [Granulicella rosea]|uniref:DNA-binding protein HU-beta n=1 Tax=Granulicella rosea TaxID=474952 RepID=A0A239JT45_9BACT|nr:HU family DNA-binding protein [Granulicella rosea]SNT08945.1 DNA-binding protein HU-beta [Granulicella rosea]